VLGSAQASIIGVAELTYQTQSIGSSTFRYFELFTIEALFYIALEQDATVDEGELIAEIMEAAANFRAVLTERTPEARRVLQSLLPDRLQFSAFEREGARGYEFLGTGTYGGLLAGYTSPTSGRGPNGKRPCVELHN